MSNEKTKKNEILSHTFKGSDEYGFTYEITFNQSLQDTIRMNAMCTGLDQYDQQQNAPTPLNAEEIIKFYLDSDRTKISIQNCMEEYASQQTAQLRQQVEELTNDLKSLIDVTEKTRKEEKAYNKRLSDRCEALNIENKALKDRNEKMEGTIKDVLLYRSAETLEIYSSSSRATSALLELQQSLNKE